MWDHSSGRETSRSRSSDFVGRNEVILVDEMDRETGTAGKMDVHVSGRLHRAFSVFLFDDRGRQLLQKRAPRKYHSGGLWSNACCSHPMPGESTEEAAHRRLSEELGVTAEIRPLVSMRYRAELGNGLVEHEFDHIFVGRIDGDQARSPNPDPAEIEDLRWMDTTELDAWLQESPAEFTPWFRLAWPEVKPAMEAGHRGTARSIFCPDGTVATFLFDDESDPSERP
jgi:isopentenyl-diphosphate delta-isomerase